MAWIQTVPPEQADSDLRAAYLRIAGERGGVAQIHQVQSLNPGVLDAHFSLYQAVMFRPSPLTRRQREELGVAVSEANDCAYCVAHHAAALDRLPPGPGLHADVLDWARRLTRTPASATADDLEPLRRAGLSDRAILDVVLVTAYFNFVNRVALALGSSQEPDYETTCGPSAAGG